MKDRTWFIVLIIALVYDLVTHYLFGYKTELNYVASVMGAFAVGLYTTWLRKD